MMGTLRIGTRGSPLALVQARLVATALRDTHGWGPEQLEIVPIATSGDMARDRPLHEIGGKELWTRELDRALIEGRTDMSVHSMKDVETIRSGELQIAAILPRADVRDRLIGAKSIAALPEAARVGTSSPRRAAQLLRRRPDLNILAIRGNVETRLRKIELGEADATLLAAAGLDRIGREETGVALDDVLPAPAQGAIGVEIRAGEPKLRVLVEKIDDADTHACIAAERAFLAALGGDCRSPVAALATCENGTIRLRAEILTMDGRDSAEGEISFAAGDGDGPAVLARQLLDQASLRLRALFTG